MKIANKLLWSTVLAGILQLSVNDAFALDNYKIFRRDYWELEASGQFFRSTSNFTSSGGAYTGLSSGNYFQQIEGGLGTRYVSDKDFAYFGHFYAAMAESKTGEIVRSNSAPSHALVGMEYLAYAEEFQIIPDIVVNIPLETYKAGGDSVMITEGVVEVQPGITLQSDFAGSLIWYSKVGFTYRDQGRSFLLPWHVGGELKLPSSRLGGRLYGFQSIADDKDSSNSATRISTSNNVNGGSLKWWAVNPSVISAEAYYRFRIADSWVGQIQAAYDLTGSNYAQGLTIGGFVRFNIDTSLWYREKDEYKETNWNRSEGQSQMYHSPAKATPLGESKFKENTEDGVDQKIFRLKPVTPEPSTGELQNELRDAEMKIKLRTNKKKKN